MESEQCPEPEAVEAGAAVTVEHGERLRCSCGYDRDHYMVSPEPQYNALDWIWVVFGITTIPFEVRFRCRTCGQTFDHTRDATLMRRYI